ncbi:hypothetical protein CFOL_v3_20656 [Cephalotus follicularis]|uniref:LTP_2 domain-containing protein n=1 Tax=Cephalotus follicularis TaxID=3775 RepID=A0A1Q3CAD6_CEPFO|nr:hypothetical protein CFOL_v3_20656 [Cephalotus follicularis]
MASLKLAYVLVVCMVVAAPFCNAAIISCRQVANTMLPCLGYVLEVEEQCQPHAAMRSCPSSEPPIRHRTAGWLVNALKALLQKPMGSTSRMLLLSLPSVVSRSLTRSACPPTAKH